MKICGKCVLSRGNSKCQDPEAGMSMFHVVNSENLDSQKLTILFNILLILPKLINKYYLLFKCSSLLKLIVYRSINNIYESTT